MTKINKEEYQVLKELENRDFKWLARDRDKTLIASQSRPSKTDEMWRDERTRLCFNYKDSQLFQFIQWEDEEPYNIAELIEEYEINRVDEMLEEMNIPTSVIEDVSESEETEVKDKKWLQDSITRVMQDLFSTSNPNYFDFEKANKQMRELVNQLDDSQPKNITLQDITHRLWDLPLNNRKYWLEQLNDEFQEGYIVPLGLKTTDGEEQYLTLNGSYFASRRNRYLQQTFATLEEIPEFYRDLAERVL